MPPTPNTIASKWLCAIGLFGAVVGRVWGASNDFADFAGSAANRQARMRHSTKVKL
jgi:hypothetical protein